MVTFRLGFDYNVSGILAGLDLWVDCLFLLDIILYTQTALWDDSGTLIVSRRAIVTRYATSWLIWDVCSTVSPTYFHCPLKPEDHLSPYCFATRSPWISFTVCRWLQMPWVATKYYASYG